MVKMICTNKPIRTALTALKTTLHALQMEPANMTYVKAGTSLSYTFCQIMRFGNPFMLIFCWRWCRAYMNTNIMQNTKRNSDKLMSYYHQLNKFIISFIKILKYIIMIIVILGGPCCFTSKCLTCFCINWVTQSRRKWKRFIGKYHRV